MTRVLAYILFVLALLSTEGCGLGQRARVETALAVLGDVAEPAYKLAVDGCVTAEQAVVVTAAQGILSEAEARERIAKIRAKCMATESAFGTFFDLYEKAADTLDSGKVDEAAAIVRKLRDWWVELKGRV